MQRLAPAGDALPGREPLQMCEAHTGQRVGVGRRDDRPTPHDGDVGRRGLADATVRMGDQCPGAGLGRLRLAVGEEVMQAAADLGLERPAGRRHLRDRHAADCHALLVGRGPEPKRERERMDHGERPACAAAVLRWLVTRRDEDHHGQIGAGVALPEGGRRQTVIVSGDPFGGHEEVVHRGRRTNADGGERGGQPGRMGRGQKQPAMKRPQLLGDGGPEHEPGVTHRQAEFRPGQERPVLPRHLSGNRVAGGHHVQWRIGDSNP